MWSSSSASSPTADAHGVRQLVHYVIGIATEDLGPRLTFAVGAIGLGVGDRIRRGYTVPVRELRGRRRDLCHRLLARRLPGPQPRRLDRARRRGSLGHAGDGCRCLGLLRAEQAQTGRRAAGGAARGGPLPRPHQVRGRLGHGRHNRHSLPEERRHQGAAGVSRHPAVAPGRRRAACACHRRAARAVRAHILDHRQGCCAARGPDRRAGLVPGLARQRRRRHQG